MIIHTRNGAAGRSIVRAQEPTGPFDWHHTSASGLHSLACTLAGSDGKTYTVQLSADDLRAIDKARVRYADKLNEAWLAKAFGG